MNFEIQPNLDFRKQTPLWTGSQNHDLIAVQSLKLDKFK